MTTRYFVLIFGLSIVFSSCAMLNLSGGGEQPDEAVAQESTTPSQEHPQNTQSAAQLDQGEPVPPIQSDGAQKTFYSLQQDLDSLKREMRTLRRYVRNTDREISPFMLQKELQKIIAIPEPSHEIELVNGTTVRGKIVRETVEAVVVQTQIGQLTLNRNLIKKTRVAEPTKAKVVLQGPIEEETHDNKKVYRGQVKNTGLRRADFVRIVFKLSDPSANVVAVDSAFVDGRTHLFNTSILSDTSVKPGETAEFNCPVYFSPGTEISYYTYEIHWAESD